MGSDSRAVGSNTEPGSFEAAFGAIVAEMQDIMYTKRRLRGTENISAQGFPGVVNRLALDKLARVKKEADRRALISLLEDRGWDWPPAGKLEDPYHGDSLEDDLLDIANYAIIATMLLRGWWDLPWDGAVVNVGPIGITTFIEREE